VDTHQITLVQTTFADVATHADEFSAVFYDHLFTIEPSLRSMFAADLSGQRQKLVDELAFIVDNLGQLPPLMARATDLGRRHVDYGVQPLHYDMVLDATLFALRAVLGDRVTNEVEIAWRRAYNLAAEMMLHGANSPAATFIDYD